LRGEKGRDGFEKLLVVARRLKARMAGSTKGKSRVQQSVDIRAEGPKKISGGGTKARRK